MDQSVCRVCAHLKEITSGRGSRFLMCQLSQADRRFKKYPPQPVVRCEGFKESEKSQEEDELHA
jgi:hypothetical protein